MAKLFVPHNRTPAFAVVTRLNKQGPDAVFAAGVSHLALEPREQRRIVMSMLGRIAHASNRRLRQRSCERHCIDAWIAGDEPHRGGNRLLLLADQIFVRNGERVRARHATYGRN